MLSNKVLVFESVPFAKSQLSKSAAYELENITTQSVFLRGDQQEADDINKFIFEPSRDESLVSWRYVGVIKTSDGTVIEILPKIFKDLAFENTSETQAHRARNVLVRMLIKAGLISYRRGPNSKLDVDDFPLLEVFIHSFLSEMKNLIRRGLKKDYVEQNENISMLKGRIHFTKHIRLNSAAQHRLYCRFDEFCTDSIENKLLATAVTKAQRISKDTLNKKLASQLLPQLDQIDELKKPEEYHFKMCRTNRHMNYYQKALKLARYILLSPPVPRAGNSDTLAILFDMSKLFEKTVEAALREDTEIKSLQAQQGLGWFIGLGSPQPDYIFCKNGEQIVADAKWKTPASGKPGKGDQYQLFTYMKLLKAGRAILIYPQLSEYGLQQAKQFDLVSENKTCSLIMTPFSLKTFCFETQDIL
ncbi:hypothetical protein [Pseudodesulfovibrio sp. zrk46]|uniref:McrC family protein n=1 Tax=Pseudodesulfovibrio sp. zrk46 TaxID=2725288 RepID=UPI0014496C08|nr:hypothetical protein [Pseudodesulfovibrio sp. zrk46]QJB56557.1 hypothetical protein HFN16_09105 [Pseudodesulfovibrio sp. zrk46]